MTRYFYLILFFSCSIIYAQVPFPHISQSTFNAERVASFGVLDVDSDFLEITNSSQFDGSFIPSIWAHQQSDNRFVLRHFATTNTIQDNGTIPMMIFRTEIRNNLNTVAPVGGSFPWGLTASNVANRPVFGWENGNTQLMRILANGFVGIGTTTPTALLNTTGTLRFQNLVDATNPFKILGTDNNGNVFEYNPAQIGSGGTSDYDWLKTDGSFPTSINDNIYTNGNVGINVLNPTANLNTNGTLKFENLADSTNPFKILGTDNIGNVFEFNPAEFSTGTTGDFDWLKTDGSFPTSINDNIYTNGNVGINVLNPTANLNTNGTLKFENLADSTNPFKILGTDNIGNVFEFNPAEFSTGTTGDFDWLKTDGSFPTSINDNIYTNGNVGINVLNPTANLNTNGTLKFENLADSTNPFKILGTDNTGNVFEFNPAELVAGATGDFDWLKTDGSFPTSINDNIYTFGKVGINTKTFPVEVGDVDVSSYSLYAKGGILTEEVRVALSSNWADFVFNKEYALEPLENVEKFILKNKHLKDVPNAAEVKKNGIELGEMNKILLQKIEELTLYLIDLNKKIEVQNEEIIKLKTK